MIREAGVMATGNSKENNREQLMGVRETFATLQEISRLLNTGLDSESLALCVRLCENGANPQALATVIKEIRKQAQALKQQDEDSSIV